MYDTLIMQKPGTSFTVDELHNLVLDLMQFGDAEIERNGSHVRVALGSAFLDIIWHDAPHVLKESAEIAQEFGVPSDGCTARFEMAGEDPEMELFNDYLLINERLQETGKFFIFDTQECKLLFDDRA